jgi:hypothetical protein
MPIESISAFQEHKNLRNSQVWWCMLVVPALGRLSRRSSNSMPAWATVQSPLKKKKKT